MKVKTTAAPKMTINLIDVPRMFLPFAFPPSEHSCNARGEHYETSIGRSRHPAIAPPITGAF